MFLSLLFFISPNEKINILTFHISLLISVSDQSCSHPDLPYHMLPLCDLVHAFSDQIPLKEQTFSYHMLLQASFHLWWMKRTPVEDDSSVPHVEVSEAWLLSSRDVCVFPMSFKEGGWLYHMQHLKGISPPEKES